VDDLGFDVAALLSWFHHAQETPYVLVKVSDVHAQAWADTLRLPVRRCYITDAFLEARAEATGIASPDIIAAVLPDPGATMAGDFGEILVYLYQASKEHPASTVGAKKWRLKQDRTKPAPFSDVVHFVLPTWPTPSRDDVVICSEVKTKATDGGSSPITAAIADSAKDRTSRLARTLVWLRERALLADLGDIDLARLERFIRATDYPPAKKRFRAVAVVCESLLARELADAPTTPPSDYTVIVISVPELHKIYSSVFEAVRLSASGGGTTHGNGAP